MTSIAIAALVLDLIPCILGSTRYIKWWGDDCKETRSQLPLVHQIGIIVGTVVTVLAFIGLAIGKNNLMFHFAISTLIRIFIF